MPRHRLGVVSIAFLALLAFPREGTAGLLDLIWEMSGPQMIGGVIGCRVDLTAGRHQCAFKRWPLERELRTWLDIEGGIYTSTGKNPRENAAGIDYKAFRTNMVAFEPMLHVRSIDPGGVVVYHGIGGLSYHFLVGSNFRRFNKFGVKFRPVGFAFDAGPLSLDVAYNLRLYANRFTPGDFGVGRRDEIDRPFETTHGFSIGLLF